MSEREHRQLLPRKLSGNGGDCESTKHHHVEDHRAQVQKLQNDLREAGGSGRDGQPAQKLSSIVFVIS